MSLPVTGDYAEVSEVDDADVENVCVCWGRRNGLLPVISNKAEVLEVDVAVAVDVAWDGHDDPEGPGVVRSVCLIWNWACCG